MTLPLEGAVSEIKINFGAKIQTFNFLSLDNPSSQDEKDFSFYSKNSVVSRKTEKNALKVAIY